MKRRRRHRKPAQRRRFAPTCWPRPRRVNGHWAYWFFEETYRENVYLIWPVDEAQRCAYIRKALGFRKVKRADDNWQGRVSEVFAEKDDVDQSGGLVLAMREWDNSTKANAVLAHECFHVVGYILSYRGVDYDNDDDAANEAFAYLLQRIVSTCHEALSMT